MGAAGGSGSAEGHEVSYELVRFSGRHSDNPMVRLITGPSLALQKLTTREPDDDQIEIAIAAMQQAIEADEGRLTDSGASPAS